LRDWQVVVLPPPVPAVEGDVEAAVVAADDVLRVLGIDPEVVQSPWALKPAVRAKLRPPSSLTMRSRSILKTRSGLSGSTIRRAK